MLKRDWSVQAQGSWAGGSIWSLRAERPCARCSGKVPSLAASLAPQEPPLLADPGSKYHAMIYWIYLKLHGYWLIIIFSSMIVPDHPPTGPQFLWGWHWARAQPPQTWPTFWCTSLGSRGRTGPLTWTIVGSTKTLVALQHPQKCPVNYYIFRTLQDKDETNFTSRDVIIRMSSSMTVLRRVPWHLR